MNEKVLIVEDEPSIVLLLEYNLKKAGYFTETVKNGEDAVELIQRKSFDLVLLDLMLPGLSGYDVSRSLRRDRIETPIIMLTAKDSEKDRIRGLEAGADDYLTKPFSPKELLARMKAILRRTANTETIQNNLHMQAEETK